MIKTWAQSQPAMIVLWAIVAQVSVLSGCAMYQNSSREVSTFINQRSADNAVKAIDYARLTPVQSTENMQADTDSESPMHQRLRD